MADQKRWFKVWTSLPMDMDNIPDELIGKWTRLGCRTALIGNAGVVFFDSWKHVAEFLKVPVSRAKSTLKRLPSVVFEEGEKCNGKVTVTFRKWRFYQEDRTSADRVRLLRSKRRGEENRSDKSKSTPLPPSFKPARDYPELHIADGQPKPRGDA